MSDLDQFLLKEIAFSGVSYEDERGVLHAVVPLDLLQRVTAEFDTREVAKQMKGRSH